MKWSTGALDSIAILDRQSIHPSEVEAATPYLGLEHLDGDGGIDCIQTVGSASLKSNKFQFSDRHVLFGKLRPYLRKIVRPEFSGVCSTDIIPILPKEGVSRDYLFYFLRTPGTVNLATSRCSGANLPRLGPKQLASFQIPLPPSKSRSGLRGFWMRRTPCGPSAARPSPSSTPSSNPPSSTCSATPSPIRWGGRSVSWKRSRGFRHRPIWIAPPQRRLLVIVDGVPLVNPIHRLRADSTSEMNRPYLSRKLQLSATIDFKPVMWSWGGAERWVGVPSSLTLTAGMLCGTGSLFFRLIRTNCRRSSWRTFSSGSMKRRLEGLSQGVTMPNLNRTMIEGLKVDSPLSTSNTASPPSSSPSNNRRPASAPTWPNWTPSSPPCNPAPSGETSEPLWKSPRTSRS